MQVKRFIDNQPDPSLQSDKDKEAYSNRSAEFMKGHKCFFLKQNPSIFEILQKKRFKI